MLEEIDAGNPEALRKYLDSRSAEISDDVLMKVSAILRDVRENGDAALRKYTEQFDGVKVEDLRISDEELQAAADAVSPSFKEAMEKAAANIRSFHEAQKQNFYLIEKDAGVYLGERVLPLSSCGIYVPGGRAQYPSSVLMNAIPAKVAGVKRIVMVTPPSKDGRLNPDIAFAAKLAGVDEVYRIGGAQAIAALAYGTESIPHVDKITGPGNIFVAAAKKLVFGKVAIDMIAGPSEILAIADEKADPAYLAADLLSQAEHDPMASAILLTPSRPLLNAVNAELEKQSAVLPKRQIVEASLKNYGKAIVEDSGDLTRIGNALPRFQYGINLDFRWNGIGLSMFFQGVGKRDWYPTVETGFFWGQYNRPYSPYLTYTQAGNNYAHVDYSTTNWVVTNYDDNPYWSRRVGYSANRNVGPLTFENDHYLQNVAYIRLKNLTIDYSLPSKWLKKIDISAARFYVSMENLWTWSPLFKHTDMFDPEVISIGDSDFDSTKAEYFGLSGVGEGYSYPMLRTFTFGVNLTF